MGRLEHMDISEILEANKLEKKLPWAQRKILIEKYFPSVAPGVINWAKFFEDPDRWGFVQQDIMKTRKAQPGRDGPRPSVAEDEDGYQELRQMWDEDYSYLPFPQAFNSVLDHYRVTCSVCLNGETKKTCKRCKAQGKVRLSIRSVAAKTHIHYSQINRFLKGMAEPSLPELISIAHAFKKDASYFVEWRMAVLEYALHKAMIGAPEASIVAYKKVTKRNG